MEHTKNRQLQSTLRIVNIIIIAQDMNRFLHARENNVENKEEK